MTQHHRPLDLIQQLLDLVQTDCVTEVSGDGATTAITTCSMRTAERRWIVTGDLAGTYTVLGYLVDGVWHGNQHAPAQVFARSILPGHPELWTWLSVNAENAGL